MRTSLHKREDRLVERLRDPEERRRGSDARAMSATSVVRGGGRNLLHEALGHLRTEGETSSACARGSGATVTNRGDGRCAQRAARGAPSQSLPSAAYFETHGRGARRSVAGSAQHGALAGAAAHSAFSEIALTMGWSAETSTKRRCETSWMLRTRGHDQKGTVGGGGGSACAPLLAEVVGRVLRAQGGVGNGKGAAQWWRGRTPGNFLLNS